MDPEKQQIDRQRRGHLRDDLPWITMNDVGFMHGTIAVARRKVIYVARGSCQDRFRKRTGKRVVHNVQDVADRTPFSGDPQRPLHCAIRSNGHVGCYEKCLHRSLVSCVSWLNDVSVGLEGHPVKDRVADCPRLSVARLACP
jgi:hypothetical protein